MEFLYRGSLNGSVRHLLPREFSGVPMTVLRDMWTLNNPQVADQCYTRIAAVQYEVCS